MVIDDTRRFFLALAVSFCLFCGLEAKSEEAQENLSKQQKAHLSLRKAKSFLVIGDLETAEFFLERADRTQGMDSLIKQRFRALSFFMDKKYAQSLAILKDRSFQRPGYFKEICLQKLVTMMMVGEMENFQADFERCSNLNRETSKTDQLWMDSLKKLIDKRVVIDRQGDDMPFLENILAIWMKLALYLGEEKIVLDNIDRLSQEQYESSTIRELLAFLYYRVGNDEMAGRFADSIESANGDNIKGRLALKKKDYKNAFNYFKLALKKRPNSQNAFEGALPLAWILGKWQEGAELLERYYPENLKQDIRKQALAIGFDIKLGLFDQAETNMRILKSLLDKRPLKRLNLKIPKIIPVMHEFIALMRGEEREFSRSSTTACRESHGISCWFVHQQMLFRDFSRIIQKKEKASQEFSLNLDSLKKKEKAVPLQEEIFIDQKEIEKLEGLLK